MPTPPKGLELEPNICVAPCLQICYGYDQRTYYENDMAIYDAWLEEGDRPFEMPLGFMKTVHIRVRKNEDREFGLRLSRQARWNQTEADWLRLLYFEPKGCFVAELDGSSVGTTTTCFLGQVAWMAMVLVDESHRRRGIGTYLLRHALEYLDSRQAPTIRLDATHRLRHISSEP